MWLPPLVNDEQHRFNNALGEKKFIVDFAIEARYQLAATICEARRAMYRNFFYSKLYGLHA
jgi:hypothetical protein